MSNPRKLDPAGCQRWVTPEYSKGWSVRQCHNPVHRDGYCRVHHPDAVAARRAAMTAKVQASLETGRAAEALRRETLRRRDVYPGLVAALQSIARNTCCGPCREAGTVARAALLAAGINDNDDNGREDEEAKTGDGGGGDRGGAAAGGHAGGGGRGAGGD